MNKKSNKAAIGATGAGAGLGAVLGSSVGIAGAFGAISGVLPLAALGGYLGFKAYKAISSTKLGQEFSGGVRDGFAEKSAELRKKRLELNGKVPPKK
jgi:uncharacterized membrane protein YebE (DUF533 family)